MATFAPGQRAATGLKSKVLEKLSELSPSITRNRIRPDSKEVLRVISPTMVDSSGELTDTIERILAGKHYSALHAFPANNEGTRRVYITYSSCRDMHARRLKTIPLARHVLIVPCLYRRLFPASRSPFSILFQAAQAPLFSSKRRVRSAAGT